MGRPSGVTHSTVCPDWAMSLALSVSQFFSRGKQGRKWLELVWAAGRPHPLPAQATLTPAADCDSPALKGSLALHQAHSHTSGLGQEDLLWVRTQKNHFSPCLCMGGPARRKGRER